MHAKHGGDRHEAPGNQAAIELAIEPHATVPSSADVIFRNAKKTG
jgi:hypothetical protein